MPVGAGARRKGRRRLSRLPDCPEAEASQLSQPEQESEGNSDGGRSGRLGDFDSGDTSSYRPRRGGDSSLGGDNMAAVSACATMQPVIQPIACLRCSWAATLTDGQAFDRLTLP